MLAPANMDMSDVWLSPTVVCGIPDGKAPKVKELKACRPRLEKELHIIQPYIVVALGATALKSLIPGNSVNHTEALGRVVDAKIQGDLVEYDIPVMVTYSLSYLIRNQDTSPGGLWNRFFTHIHTAIEVADQLAEIERQQ